MNSIKDNMSNKSKKNRKSKPQKGGLPVASFLVKERRRNKVPPAKKKRRPLPPPRHQAKLSDEDVLNYLKYNKRIPKTPNKNSNTNTVPTMVLPKGKSKLSISEERETSFTFWFFRHGYSCANMARHKKIGADYFRRSLMLRKGKLKKGDITFKDPHLTNWGIATSIMAGQFVTQNKLIPELSEFDGFFCSPLIRTWETAACMFPDTSIQFVVAPYLREGGHALEFITDMPFTYGKNLERFDTFKAFVTSSKYSQVRLRKNKDKLPIHMYPILKAIPSIQNELGSITNDIKAFNISCPVKNCNTGYPPLYTEEGNLRQFIDWYIDNHAKKGKVKLNTNVLVVTHGGMIKGLFQTLGTKKQFFGEKVKFNPEIFNNYGAKVVYKGGKITASLIFHGVADPTGKVLKSLMYQCSLCEIDEACDSEGYRMDKQLHTFITKDSVLPYASKNIQTHLAFLKQNLHKKGVQDKNYEALRKRQDAYNTDFSNYKTNVSKKVKGTVGYETALRGPIRQLHNESDQVRRQASSLLASAKIKRRKGDINGANTLEDQAKKKSAESSFLRRRAKVLHNRALKAGILPNNFVIKGRGSQYGTTIQPPAENNENLENARKEMIRGKLAQREALVKQKANEWELIPIKLPKSDDSGGWCTIL